MVKSLPMRQLISTSGLVGVKGRTQVYKFFRTQIQLIKMFGELHVPSEVAIVLPRVIFVPKLSQARAKLCQIGS